MDEFMSVLTQSNDIDELNKEQLKEHLKKVVSSEVYDKWVQYFEFEKMDDEKLVIGYYGKASLRKFENKYKKKVWLEICSFIGCVKKLEIVKRKKQPMPEPEKVVPSYIPEEDFDGYIASYTGLTNKIHMFFRTVEQRDQAWELVKDEPYSIMSSTVNDLELMPPGVDKGLGMRKLAEHLGLTAEQIMTIGDGGNDVDMLRQAGIGVAMANASEEAKAAADHILAWSNDEDGVAKAVWAVIKGEPLP